MESDSALHGDVPDGAEISPMSDNPVEAIGDEAVNNIAPDESEAVPVADNGGMLFYPKLFKYIMIRLIFFVKSLFFFYYFI